MTTRVAVDPTSFAVTLEERYRRATPGSKALWDRATRIMPSGVSASIKYFAPYPVYLESGIGGTVRDVDGRTYVDLVMGAGPHILGHADPEVIEAIRVQAGRITQHLSPAVDEVAFAERLAEHFPQLERVRFANTGSEAIRSAVRVARAMTGRTMIAKCEGLYHGSDDAVMVSSTVGRTDGTADRPVGVADSAGIPGYVIDDTLILPFNDPIAAEALIAEHGDRLAAVLLEPIAFSSGGAIAATRPFVETLRAATSRVSAVLIFDEVVTALRLGSGGASTYFGVVPDLTCVGKAIGGGMAIAAFGGRADLMEGALGLDAARKGTRIFQSGTFTANPLAIAAGNVVLERFRSGGPVARLDALAERLRAGLDDLFVRQGVAARTTGAASIFQVHFTEAGPRNRREILGGDMTALHSFMLGLLAEGILWTPVHPGLTCLAHTETQIDAVIAAAGRVLEHMAPNTLESRAKA
jgi:glutamate-1-semialdehyde 2,1-aminomutase